MPFIAIYFFSSSLQFIRSTCEVVDIILSPVALCHSFNSFTKNIVGKVKPQDMCEADIRNRFVTVSGDFQFSLT